MTVEFHVLTYDDWSGLFVNGELVHEGHTVEISDLIRAAGSTPFRLTQSVEPEGLGEYLADHGRFAHRYLGEVLREMEELA